MRNWEREGRGCAPPPPQQNNPPFFFPASSREGGSPGWSSTSSLVADMTLDQSSSFGESALRGRLRGPEGVFSGVGEAPTPQPGPRFQPGALHCIALESESGRSSKSLKRRLPSAREVAATRAGRNRGCRRPETMSPGVVRPAGPAVTAVVLRGGVFRGACVPGWNTCGVIPEGWTGGPSAAGLGEGGRNARRQGVPRRDVRVLGPGISPPDLRPRAPPLVLGVFSFFRGSDERECRHQTLHRPPRGRRGVGGGQAWAGAGSATGDPGPRRPAR